MNSPYRAGTRRGGMDDQEFVNETVFDKRIIKSPAKRNYRPNGTGRGGCAAFCSIGLPGRDYPVFHESVKRKSVKTLCRIFFCAFCALVLALPRREIGVYERRNWICRKTKKDMGLTAAGYLMTQWAITACSPIKRKKKSAAPGQRKQRTGMKMQVQNFKIANNSAFA